MSIVRIGLAETKDYSEGWESIFGKKKKETKKVESEETTEEKTEKTAKASKKTSKKKS